MRIREPRAAGAAIIKDTVAREGVSSQLVDNGLRRSAGTRSGTYEGFCWLLGHLRNQSVEQSEILDNLLWRFCENNEAVTTDPVVPFRFNSPIRHTR
jgi:hypothetical protein